MPIRVKQRRCARCTQYKPVTDFHAFIRKGRRGLASYCTPCANDVTRKAQAEKKEWVDNYKLERGCADCGYADHPAALDFDHQPGTEKVRDVRHGSSFGWEALFAEVAKCEVVCANCHRIRTVTRAKGGDVLCR